MLQDDLAVMRVRNADGKSTGELAAQVARRATYLEWYAIRVGEFIIVIPKEEGYGC